MQLSLLLFLHNLLCFHLSRALGSRYLSLVPLCGSIPPAGPLHWFSSWQYPGIRVPLCHRLIHEPGFKIHSFYSGGIFSEVLKSKPEGFQACFTSWSELKYFLSCSLVYHNFCSFSPIFLVFCLLYCEPRVSLPTFNDLAKTSDLCMFFCILSVKLTLFPISQSPRYFSKQRGFTWFLDFPSASQRSISVFDEIYWSTWVAWAK